MKTLARARDLLEIQRRLLSVRPDHRARWGRMSAHQMVCHLADAIRMATGEKPVAPDTNVFKMTVLKWIVLYAPLRWPAGILTSPEIDQQRGGGTIPIEFAADVRETERQLTRMVDEATNLEGRPHPFFGRMSHAAWLRWSYLHADHHLRQFGA